MDRKLGKGFNCMVTDGMQTFDSEYDVVHTDIDL